jgi:tetratricopeptide (TPR) repeat protein
MADELKLSIKPYFQALLTLSAIFICSIALTFEFKPLIYLDFLLGIILIPFLVELGAHLAWLAGIWFVLLADVAASHLAHTKRLIALGRLHNRLPLNPFALTLPLYLSWLARQMEETGNESQAEEILRECVAVLERQKLSDKRDLLVAKLLLAKHLTKKRNTAILIPTSYYAADLKGEEAKQLREKTLALIGDMTDKQLSDQRALLSSLSAGLAADGRIKEAQTVAARSVSLMENSPVNQTPKAQLLELANALSNLGQLYEANNDLEAATEPYQRALAIRIAEGSSASRLEALTLHCKLAHIFLEQNKLVLANKHLALANQIEKQRMANSIEPIACVLIFYQAILRAKRHELKEAFLLAKRGDEMLKRLSASVDRSSVLETQAETWLVLASTYRLDGDCDNAAFFFHRCVSGLKQAQSVSKVLAERIRGEYAILQKTASYGLLIDWPVCLSGSKPILTFARG